ncbi:MAG: nuclear transport factor 2 family protein [Actinomycetes bacterium]
MTDANKALVNQFWQALYARDFDAVASFFGPNSTYTDVATPPEDLAVGPDQVVARLKLGIAQLERYDHTEVLMVAEGNVVVTEHIENWTWSTGEEISFPFTSIHVIEDGRIARWTDYWDLSTLLNAAPAWWIESIASGYL